MNFEEQFERANRRAKEMHEGMPRALSARYDRGNGRIVIALSSGLEVGFLPEQAQGLAKADPAALQKIEITT